MAHAIHVFLACRWASEGGRAGGGGFGFHIDSAARANKAIQAMIDREVISEAVLVG